MNITKNQVELLKEKFLRTLGGSRDQFNFPVLNGILKEYAEAFLQEAIDNLNKTNSIASGNIADDLTFSIEQGKGNYVLTIGYSSEKEAAKYYDYINKGVAGVGKSTNSPYSFKTVTPSKKHVSAIEKWIESGKFKVQATDVTKYSPTRQESKSVKFRNSEPKSLAYMVARSIKIKGIKATHFFDDAIKDVFNGDFKNILSEALASDVEIQLTQIKLN